MVQYRCIFKGGVVVDLNSFEDVIKRIDGVLHVKMIANESETDLAEIHVLANNHRAPKQIVRDIESSLLAAFDYRIDRKTLSIAQIETDEPSRIIKRIRFDGLAFKNSGNYAECSVKLIFEDEEFESTQSGIKTASNTKKIVAEAAIKAVEKILGQGMLFDIQDVIVTEGRDVSFVSVLVNVVIRGIEETLVGSSIVKNDLNEAIVKAALDAINRRIEKSSAK